MKGVDLNTVIPGLFLIWKERHNFPHQEAESLAGKLSSLITQAELLAFSFGEGGWGVLGGKEREGEGRKTEEETEEERKRQRRGGRGGEEEEGRKRRGGRGGQGGGGDLNSIL